MFDDIQYISLFTRATSDIVFNVSLALLCGLFIARVYRLTYRGPGYANSFLHALVLLCMITSLVIMVIGNNLARAFGLVGAMSIIRFRTAVKETLDIVYIFFSLAMGMAAGVGYHKIAIIGTLFVGAVFYTFSKTRMVASNQKEYLLQFTYASDGKETPEYQHVFRKYFRRYHIINVKSIQEHGTLELSYYIRFKDENKSNRFVQDLQRIEGVHNINLFFDEEEF